MKMRKVLVTVEMLVPEAEGQSFEETFSKIEDKFSPVSEYPVVIRQIENGAEWSKEFFDAHTDEIISMWLESTRRFRKEK